MSDTTTFTINLVSNAFMELIQTHTMARFTTLLPQKIELFGGEWEVALLEASWPAKVKKITNAAFTISRFDADTNKTTRLHHNQLKRTCSFSVTGSICHDTDCGGGSMLTS